MTRLLKDIVDLELGAQYEIVQLLGRQSKPERQELSIAVETILPGVAKPKHFHRKSEEIFFVVRGKGVLTVEELEFPLGETDAFLVEVGQKHFLRAPDDCELSVLLISTPAYEPSDYVLC